MRRTPRDGRRDLRLYVLYVRTSGKNRRSSERLATGDDDDDDNDGSFRIRRKRKGEIKCKNTHRVPKKSTPFVAATHEVVSFEGHECDNIKTLRAPSSTLGRHVT